MSKEKKIIVGNTEFIREQWEEGVEQKVKGTPPTSLWYISKSKKK
jgi:hypothetical protein